MSTPLRYLRQQSPGRLAVLGAGAAIVLALLAWGTTAAVRLATAEPNGLADPSVTASTTESSADPGATVLPGASTGSGTPAPGNSPAPDANAIAGMEDRVVTLVNARRATGGCSAATVDSRLAQAARAHARDMAARGYFSHTTPEGAAFDARIRDTGYGLSSAAENIAYGQTTADSVTEAWMGSADHRANILNCSLRQVGVGLAYSADNSPYWVLDLASPA